MVGLGFPILADTHYVIWIRTDPGRLTRGERDFLDSATDRYVSLVSLWEIAILIGRRRIPDNDAWLTVPIGFRLLPIGPQHCAALLDLPRLHNDPFDRMLIAQSRSEQVQLLTRDRRISAYQPFAPIIHHPP